MAIDDEKEKAISAHFEAYRDVYGYKPRGFDYDKFSAEELYDMVDDMYNWYEESGERERQKKELEDDLKRWEEEDRYHDLLYKYEKEDEERSVEPHDDDYWDTAKWKKGHQKAAHMYGESVKLSKSIDKFLNEQSEAEYVEPPISPDVLTRKPDFFDQVDFIQKDILDTALSEGFFRKLPVIVNMREFDPFDSLREIFGEEPPEQFIVKYVDDDDVSYYYVDRQGADYCRYVGRIK